MAASIRARNAALDAMADIAGYASLHTGDPGESGKDEAVADRQRIAWNRAAAGYLTSANQPVFTVGRGRYTHFGLWDAPSGGDYIDGGPLGSPEEYAGDGTYTLTAITITQD